MSFEAEAVEISSAKFSPVNTKHNIIMIYNYQVDNSQLRIQATDMIVIDISLVIIIS